MSLFHHTRSKSREAIIRSHTTCCAFLALSFYIMIGCIVHNTPPEMEIAESPCVPTFACRDWKENSSSRYLSGDNTVNGVNPIALPCTRALTGVHDNNFPLERTDDDIMEHVKAIASLTMARTGVFLLEASNVDNCVIKCTQTQCRHLSASASLHGERDEIFSWCKAWPRHGISFCKGWQGFACLPT